MLKQRLVLYTMDVDNFVPWIRLRQWQSDLCKLCFANDSVTVALRRRPTFVVVSFSYLHSDVEAKKADLPIQNLNCCKKSVTVW